MKSSHIHVGVTDLPNAIRWFGSICGLEPAFQNQGMAVLPVGGFSLILDEAKENSRVTVAFDSQDCQGDFDAIVKRGAHVLEPPEQTPWGTVSAYLRGPGALTLEIEQVLAHSSCDDDAR